MLITLPQQSRRPDRIAVPGGYDVVTTPLDLGQHCHHWFTERPGLRTGWLGRYEDRYLWLVPRGSGQGIVWPTEYLGAGPATSRLRPVWLLRTGPPPTHPLVLWAFLTHMTAQEECS